MEYLANRMARWIAQNGGDADSQEVYAYGIECALNTVVTFGIILAVGVAIDRIGITLIWFAFFLPLRHTSGGLHASSHIGCLAISLSVGIGCMLLNPYFSKTWLIVAGLIISLVIIVVYAPVIHPNHPVPVRQIRKIRSTARAIIVIESIVAAVFIRYGLHTFAAAALLGILSASLSTLIGHFRNR